MYEPLDIAMKKRNDAYYKSGKTRIYCDFLTYAQNPKGALPRALAGEIYRKIIATKGDFRILEAGVGEGGMALGIASGIAALDKKNKTSALARVLYCLADFSPAMLRRAQKRMAKSGCATKTFVANPSEELPAALSKMRFSQIICNELFSDIPSKIFIRKGAKISEGIYSPSLAWKASSAKSLTDAQRLILSCLPEGYLIPVNSSALAACRRLLHLLLPGGRMDVFDYGFYFAEDFSLPAEFWNRSVVREYGSQWTVDLNFILMSSSLRATGFSIFVQAQMDFAQTALGIDFSLSDSKSGLDYAKKGEFSESDSFYHMRVEKSA